MLEADDKMLLVCGKSWDVLSRSSNAPGWPRRTAQDIIDVMPFTTPTCLAMNRWTGGVR